MPKPRFTLVVKGPSGVTEKAMREFYTLRGLWQWLENARATGEVGKEDKVSVYDDSGCRL